MSAQFLTTYTGRRFYPLAPRAEDVCIEDIAAALSKICRFNGHSSQFYSVAEHSYRCAQQACLLPEADRELRLAALLHDAAETYLCDLPRPIKLEVSGYKEAEARVQKVIAEHFGLDPTSFEHPAIKTIDNRMLATELVALVNHGGFEDWSWDLRPMTYRDVDLGKSPLPPFPAEQVFLSGFRALSGSRDGEPTKLGMLL